MSLEVWGLMASRWWRAEAVPVTRQSTFVLSV